MGLGVGGGLGGPFGRARGPVVGGWAGCPGLLAGCLALVPLAFSAASSGLARGGLVWVWGLLASGPFGAGGLCPGACFCCEFKEEFCVHKCLFR